MRAITQIGVCRDLSHGLRRTLSISRINLVVQALGGHPPFVFVRMFKPDEEYGWTAADWLVVELL